MEELLTGFGLIEGPVWSDTVGLVFSDVVNGGVRALGRDGDVATLVPKRRGVGGMALHEDGRLVMGGRDVILQPPAGGEPATLLTAEVAPGTVGFNDLTTDQAGRIWVGSLAYRVVAGEDPKPGHLHVIDLDGSVRTVADGVMLTNGLGFSPDGRTLYHSDSREHLIRAYEVTAEGEVGSWRVFARVTGGIPDGMAVAEDGSVWIALADGGLVLVFEPDGTPRTRIPVPLPMVTSVCFGGKDLDELYIVTGSRGGPQENCGTIFRMKAPVRGLPIPPARVRA